MLTGAYKDFYNFLTDLAKSVEKKFASVEGVEIINADLDMDVTTGTVLTMKYEDELTITYDLLDINDEPGESSCMDITCSYGDRSRSFEITRDNETFEYDEETGEDVMESEAGIQNEAEYKVFILKYIEEMLEEFI